ncbi:hypothetical protein [Pedobacter faecalis]|uniref:hypothetical protein n=1 Tax=Pedobacter faecalis TaxID=3041495 RepID=UPI00254AA57B|nr:hypothetical protein [Pedobacter sp. ELA7]
MRDNEIIQGTPVWVLNSIVTELMRYGYSIAMHGELADLNGMVNTGKDEFMREDSDEVEIISIDDDLELLSTVSDPAVKLIMSGIEKILECKRTYLLVTGIDEFELLEDEDCGNEAEGIMFVYNIDLECDGSYASKVRNLSTFYGHISFMIYSCIGRLELGQLDIFDEGEALYFDTSQEKQLQNKYSQLLADLNRDLITEQNAIWDYEGTLT